MLRSIPPHWVNGNNTLIFRHTRSGGFVINNVSVSFAADFVPVTAVSSESINFGNVDVGSISNPLTLVLTNSGSAPLIISGITMPSEYIETNDCNNYLPVNENCNINISFVPTSSGTKSDTLTIADNTADGVTEITLRGTANAVSTPTQPPSGNLAFHVDFENRVANTTYTEAQLIQDFNANNNDGKIHGPDYGNTRIVSDPGNTGRGNVLRTRHPAGKFGSAMSFKARFAPDNANKKGSARFDEVYFAYDLYLAPNSKRMLMHKLPGLITGTLLEASHAADKPEPEGIKSFSVRMQSYAGGTFASRPFDGALSAYTYDAEKTQKPQFLDTVNSTQETPGNSYTMPLGQWFTIEQRIKLNKADSKDAYNSSADRKDGVIEVWVNGRKMLSKTHLWRWTNTMKADGFWVTSYYNNTSATKSLGQTAPTKDQYEYYDNFRVSTSPLTH